MSSEQVVPTVENGVHTLYQIEYVLLIVFLKQPLGNFSYTQVPHCSSCLISFLCYRTPAPFYPGGSIYLPNFKPIHFRFFFTYLALVIENTSEIENIILTNPNSYPFILKTNLQSSIWKIQPAKNLSTTSSINYQTPLPP